ncbi:hypothetical protein [Catenulispora rubra]|uniref:hypothetical protein n=1 Tax=Catenulispora rubra TaxID=280293 RepID=UPI00189282A9|nr:hypothetical protein [Catenulispora rubra]
MAQVILGALGEPGESLGIFSTLTKPVWLPLWRSTEWTGSWRLHSKRGEIGEKSASLIGDILWYQVRGDAIRTCIAETVATAEPPVVVLAHSLGGVACVDLFAQDDYRDVVSALITVGSQAPFLMRSTRCILCAAVTAFRNSFRRGGSTLMTPGTRWPISARVSSAPSV